jgi:UDP-N-acetylmuramate--alanine ligase
MNDRSYQVHFVGIGGIGMSGIAEVLLNLGYLVSGSDLVESESTRRLASLGARVWYGHRRENLGQADVVVVSSAVRPDNPEVLEARQRRIPVIPRAEMLAELMRMKRALAVAGSHGKTTTTSLIAWLLYCAGLDPTVIVGGKVNQLGSNARLGQGEYLVAEADESDGSFLRYYPQVAVITNIDPEHLDHFGNFQALQDAFCQFANQVPFYGLVVACADHPGVQDILPRIEKRLVTYGFSSRANWQARGEELFPGRVAFEAFYQGRSRGRYQLSMNGRHNVLNALAVLAVAEELKIDPEQARQALASFSGVQRRFTYKGEAGGIAIFDDYGHHPEEIRATLEGARAVYRRRLVVVFQPHRYSRTRDLEASFHTAFGHADVLAVMDIYPAGEPPLAGVSASKLVEGIRAQGKEQVF